MVFKQDVREEKGERGVIGERERGGREKGERGREGREMIVRRERGRGKRIG
jgi:hypothetical protein